MLLLMLVSLYLMSLFASGQRHALRARDYSQATLLAHQRLEEARAVPVAELENLEQAEPDPYRGFVTHRRLEPYEAGLWMLTVETRAPSGASARACALVSQPFDFTGVICDPFSHRIVWLNGSDLMAWDDSSASVRNLGPAGDARTFGALCGIPGSNQIWRGASRLGPMAYAESLPTPGTWSPALGSPVSSPDDFVAPPRFTGMAGDFTGHRLVLCDAANRGLWFWQGSAWSSVVRPRQTALGKPSGICCDTAMSLIWVADQDYQCLRKWLGPAASALYPAAQLESAGGIGNWHRSRFRPPATMGFGSPCGLAMDPLGWGVYVHDGSRLYRFLDGENRWELLGSMPAALVEARPSGLCTDRFGHQVYLCTQQGSLWKVRASTGLATSDYKPLWP